MVHFAEAGLNEQQISNWIEEKDIFTSQDLIKLQKAHDNENVLLVAARTGNYKIMKSIVDLSKDDINNIVLNFSCYNQNGENALHLGMYNSIMKL